MEQQMYHQKPMLRQRTLFRGRNGYLIAALLCFVGVGNIWIGHSKREYYQTAFARAIQRPTRSQSRSPLDRTLDTDSIYAKRLASRISYYEVVFHGGAVLVVVSFSLVLWQVTRARRRKMSEESDLK